MSDALEALNDQAKSRLVPRAQPDWTEPMLATLWDEVFSAEDWVYERKLDGVRTLVFIRGKQVRLMSRNQQNMNDTYPELVDALRQQSCRDLIADGEIVAFEGNHTSFARLQQRIGVRDAAAARRTGVAVYLYLFDLLHLDGHDVTRLTLRERKALLRQTLQFGNQVRFTPHRNGEGEKFHAEACAKGWEGLIAKDANAPYVHKRSRAWLKLKCVHRQELVIGGFTEPKGSRRGFGALLVGHYDRGKLRYAGKVGTGYDDRTLQQLGSRLRDLERERSPFASSVSEKGAHWVEPRLVGEFGFTEWTGDGKLRHPRFIGLRRDKSPREVHRERPG